MMEDDPVYRYGSLFPIKAYQVMLSVDDSKCRSTHQITIGVSFALTILSYVAESGIKIKTHRFQFADELLPLLGLMFLIPCTSLAFVGADPFYRGYTVLRPREPISNTPADDYDYLGRTGTIRLSSFTTCAWTTISRNKAHTLRICWSFLHKVPWIRGCFRGSNYLYWHILGSSLHYSVCTATLRLFRA